MVFLFRLARFAFFTLVLWLGVALVVEEEEKVVVALSESFLVGTTGTPDRPISTERAVRLSCFSLRPFNRSSVAWKSPFFPKGTG